MNRYVTFLPIAILILGGTGIVSQAFAATVMTLETDNQIYDHASTIILTGNVFPVDLRGSEVTIVCKSPGGAGVCGIQQVQPNSDGDFSVMFNTSSSLFRADGIYEFEAKYSILADATVSVELVDAIGTSESSASESSEIGMAVSGTITTQSGGTLHELGAGQLEYDMTCDADPAFFANSDDCLLYTSDAADE